MYSHITCLSYIHGWRLCAIVTIVQMYFHMIVQKFLIDQPFLLIHGKVMFKESCKISLGENPNIADEKLVLLSNLTRICNIYILYAAALLKFDIINFCAN